MKPEKAENKGGKRQPGIFFWQETKRSKEQNCELRLRARDIMHEELATAGQRGRDGAGIALTEINLIY